MPLWLYTLSNFGVLPYLHGLQLDAEDAIKTEQGDAAAGERLRVIVSVLPRISNHTDFDALRAHPQVELTFVGPGMRVPPILSSCRAARAYRPISPGWSARAGWTRSNGICATGGE